MVCYIFKNYLWWKPKSKVMTTTPGLTRYAMRNVDTKLFMKPNIIRDVIKLTNKEGTRVYRNMHSKILRERKCSAFVDC